MATKIFIINDTSITGGADDTSDLGSSSVRWKNLYLSTLLTVSSISANLITVGTVSATGNIITQASFTIGTGTIAAAKITATTGSFTALLTAGTASISGAIIGGTTLTVGTASFSGNLITVGTSSLGNITFADNRTVLVGTGTGLTFATATNQKIGFYGATPIVQSAAYSTSNVTTDRTFDANATSLDEVADVLSTLIADLRALGVLG